MNRAAGFLASLCVSCVGVIPAPLAENPVSGDVVIARPSGEQRYRPDACLAGAREMFYGFDLGSTADAKFHLRAVVEPISGVAVKLTAGSEEFIVRERDCSTLRVDVRPTGWRVNEDRDYAGSVVMECRAADATLRANVEIRACH